MKNLLSVILLIILSQISVADIIPLKSTGVKNSLNPCGLSANGFGVDACKNLCVGKAYIDTLSIVGNTGSVSFQWDTGLNDTLSYVNNLCEGIYNCTITDSIGCSINVEVSIEDTIPIEVYTTYTTSSNDGACDGSATINVCGGTAPYAYLWAHGDPAQTINFLCEGFYGYDVTDANGCYVRGFVIISTNPDSLVCSLSSNFSATVEDEICGQNNGAVYLDGPCDNVPFDFQWDDLNDTQNDTLMNVPAGNYSCIISTIDGCRDTVEVVVGNQVNFTANISTSAALCDTCSDGSITVAINEPGVYTYSWYEGCPAMNPMPGNGNALTGLSAGDYTVLIQDQAGCQQTECVSVGWVDCSQMGIAVSVLNEHCGQSDGGISIDSIYGGAAPYTFLWSTGSTFNQLTSTPAGCYSVIIEDSIGCMLDTTICVTDNPGPSVSVLWLNDVSCAGGSDGSFGVNILGGNGNPSVIVFDSQSNVVGNTSSPYGLPEGCYEVEVIDSLGCQSAVQACLTEPSPLSSSTSSTPAMNTNDGTASVVVSGGTSGYTYLWNDSLNQTTATATGLVSGYYVVIVSDANGCEISDSIFVDDITGVSFLKESTIKVYPNPSSGEVWIELGNGVTSGDIELRLSDVAGRLVYKEFISSNTKRIYIPLSNYLKQSGVYWIELRGAANGMGKILFVNAE